MQNVTFSHQDTQTGTEYTVRAQVSEVYYNEDFEWSSGSVAQVDVDILGVVDGEGYEVSLEHFTIFQIQDMRDAAVDALSLQAYQDFKAEQYVSEIKAA